MIHPYILYAAIAIVCVGTIATYIMVGRMKTAKGKLEIKLTKGRANFRDTVDGDVSVECLKDIELDSVEVSLVTYLRKKSGTVSGNAGRRTVYSETPIYTKTIVLRDSGQLRAGSSETLAFSFPMPSPLFDGPDEKKLRKYFTLEHQRDIRWEVTAKMRCAGLDLNNKARLVVPYISADHAQAA